MCSFRIHAVHQTAFGRFPFLTLSRLANGKVEIDMTCLGNDLLPRLQIPPDLLYDLLEGRCVDVSSDEAYLALTPLEDRVLFECTGKAGSIRQFLWIAEIALAWNMMTRTRGWRFKLA